MCVFQEEYGIRGLVRSFFFFEQYTAYGLLLSLVGSEMCIGDRCWISLELAGMGWNGLELAGMGWNGLE